VMLRPWLRTVVAGAIAADGASQADLARAAGITPKHLCQLLKGRADGSLDCWEQLLHLVGVRLPGVREAIEAEQ
jgi:DNA-binding XRE family transcriptional regulator